jgi:hypothetical protein
MPGNLEAALELDEKKKKTGFPLRSHSKLLEAITMILA